MKKMANALIVVSSAGGLFITFLLLLSVLSGTMTTAMAASGHGGKDGEDFVASQKEPFERKEVVSNDPLEPMNRAFFQFNDRLYFWVVKPVCKVYKTFVPPGVRQVIKNGFANLRTPIRFLNCLFQGKSKAASVELKRFFINSTLGVGGLFDIAKTHFNLERQDEDFGQTLAVHGVRGDVYVDWPILGPSTVRDTIGLLVDFFMDPLTYLSGNLVTRAEIQAGKEATDTSFRLGEYEDLKESAVDPYVALRNAYLQHRREQIKQ